MSWMRFIAKMKIDFFRADAGWSFIQSCCYMNEEE